MKFKLFLTLVFISISLSSVLAQGRYYNKLYRFSMEKPSGFWKENDHFNRLRSRHADFEFTKENLQQFLLENSQTDFNGNAVKSLKLVSYLEKDPNRTGYCPSLSVRIVLNETKNFNEFKEKTINFSSFFLKKVPEDLEFEITPQTIQISGIKSIYYTYTYSFQDTNGNKNMSRAFFCAIPHGSYYFQLFFFDRPNEIDYTKVYNKIINSIKIDK